MSKITFKDIYIDGNKITEDTRKVIYLLPSQPLKYASNTWIYKTMPTMNQWLKDIEVQKKNLKSNPIIFFHFQLMKR